MGIAIITDSTCDMKREVRQQLNVEMVPLTVSYNNVSYKDGSEGMFRKLFYKQLRAGHIFPQTSQPSPNEFLKIFNRCKEQGDDAIYIGISSNSSGTLQAAQIAKNICGYDRIYIVDSHQLSHGLEVLVRIACDMRDKDMQAPEIVMHINALIPRIKFLSSVDNLTHLIRGGRVQSNRSDAQRRLGMKHIVAMVEGRFTPIAKVRGKVNAYEKIHSLMTNHIVNIDYPVVLTHADNKEDMIQFEDFLRIKGFKKEFFYSEIGTVIGSHMGPGTIGIAYVEK